MLHDLGYSEELFQDFDFSEVFVSIRSSGCKDPTCTRSCTNCKDGCNGGPD